MIKECKKCGEEFETKTTTMKCDSCKQKEQEEWIEAHTIDCTPQYKII